MYPLGKIMPFFIAVLCTAAINKWRDWERKSTIQKQQQFNGQTLKNQSNGVQKAIE